MWPHERSLLAFTVPFLPVSAQGICGGDGVGDHVGGHLKRLVVNSLSRSCGAASDLGRAWKR